MTVRAGIGVMTILCAAACDRGSDAKAPAPMTAPAPAPAPPRVVLVTLDTLRADHVGCYGCPRPTTPNLDAFARIGTRFTRAVAPLAATAPSHSSMLSGRQPLSHGLVNHLLSLSNDVVMLPEILRQTGVASVVAYHLFPFADMNVTQGFDERIRDMSREAKEVVPSFLRWFDALRKDQPCFAWLHFYLAHTPLRPPQKFLDRFVTPPSAAKLDDRNEILHYLHTHPEAAPPGFEQTFGQIYDAKVAFDDQRFGELVNGLRSRHALENVLLIVTADHGESLDPGMYGMHIYDARETTMHVPLIMAGPRVPAGKTVDAVVQLVDLFPTILETLGGTTPQNIDGASLWPLLNGDGGDRDSFAWGMLATEREDQEAGRLPKEVALWKGPYKLVVADPEGAAKERLYDLSRDPTERNDIAAEHPDIVRAMRRQLDACIASARAAATAPGELNEKGRDGLKQLGYADH